MKKFIPVLLLLFITKSYGQDAYSKYQKCLESIDKQAIKAKEAVEDNWYEENPDPKKYATMACNDHGPKFQCRKHRKQCESACSCANNYYQEIKSLEAKFQSFKNDCENNYKKQQIEETAKVEREKKQRAQSLNSSQTNNNTQQYQQGQKKQELENIKEQQLALLNQQSVAIASNSKTAQQQQYQNAADNYLNAANNSNNDINKAMNLNLAKINATASGNKAQVAQIQHQQNQEMQQGITNLGTQLIALLSTSSKKAPIRLTTAEKQLKDDVRLIEICEKVSADIGYTNGIIGWDKYSHSIRAEDIVVNNERQNNSGYEMYINGVFENGKYNNPQRAMEWFIKAADKNYPRALVRLAKMTESQDKNLSALLYLKAAVLVDSPVYRKDNYTDYEMINKAMYETAVNYEQGNFDSKTNYAEAIKWFKRALEKGDDYCIMKIAKLYAKGDNSLISDTLQSFTWFKKAIESPNKYIAVRGLKELAELYEKGEGFEENFGEAIKFYEQLIAKAKLDKDDFADDIKEAKESIKRCKKAKK